MLLGIPRSARCVQRFDDSLKICNSHYLSHFAAFFIDARTKRSVVESFKYNSTQTSLNIEFGSSGKHYQPEPTPEGGLPKQQRYVDTV